MFASGEGTCADIVAYDAAALRSKGHDVVIMLERLPSSDGSRIYHAVLVVDGERQDPSEKIAAATVAQHNVGRCGCA